VLVTRVLSKGVREAGKQIGRLTWDKGPPPSGQIGSEYKRDNFYTHFISDLLSLKYYF
jgi:hypothetical protein